MLQKTIKYIDYNGQERVEDFYFNFTKLETMEMLEVEDLQSKITAIENAKSNAQAYYLFKDMILRAYGVKTEDGKYHHKSPEIRANFEASPALGELIFSFLESRDSGAKFIEALFPGDLIEQAKEELRKQGKEVPDELQNFGRPEVTSQPVVTDTTAPKDPKDMTHEELLAAYRERASQ